MSCTSVKPSVNWISSRQLLAVALVLTVGIAVAAPAPEPAPDVVRIPIEGAADLVFRAVYLGIDGKGLFSTRPLKLGSREPDPSYKERLVETALGGSFVGHRNERPEWLYYLSETEVQQGQWQAFMQQAKLEGDNFAWVKRPLDDLGPESTAGANLPQTAVTFAEIQLYCEQLNAYFLGKHADRLPKFHGAPAFARLPTEAEWAFAARGGIVAMEGSDPDLFNRAHPYGDAILDHEWLRGSSGGKVQPVGELDANPIGLHDMLGNVEEYTISLFGPEYQQGRFGLYVIRGANFSSLEDDVSVAQRNEAFTHDIRTDRGDLLRPSKVGFRLALSSPLSAARLGPAALDQAFDEYQAQRPFPRPGPVGKTTPAAQSNADALSGLQSELERLRGENTSLRGRIDTLTTQLDDMGEGQRPAAGALDSAGADQLRAERDALAADLNKAEQHAAVLELQLAALSDDNAELSRDARDAMREAAALRDQLVERERDLARLGTETLVAEDAAGSALRRELEALRASNQRLTGQLEELEQRRAKAAERLREGVSERQQLKQELNQSQVQLAALDGERDRLQARLDQLAADHRRLQQRIEGNASTDRAGELMRLATQLEGRETQLSDLRRRLAISEQAIVDNVGRLYSSESRFLEALMRQASANAYLGWRALLKASAILDLPANSRRDKQHRLLMDEGRQMVHDYWELVVAMAQDTDAGLFPEVKQRLSDWLRQREGSSATAQQRKTLDMIGRHVAMVRAGSVRRPPDLVETFLNQPELR